jgi:hypothetical protein
MIQEIHQVYHNLDCAQQIVSMLLLLLFKLLLWYCNQLDCLHLYQQQFLVIVQRLQQVVVLLELALVVAVLVALVAIVAVAALPASVAVLAATELENSAQLLLQLHQWLLGFLDPYLAVVFVAHVAKLFFEPSMSFLH